MRALNGEFFIVKVNKYGKKTHSNIRAIEMKRTMSEIIITTICNETLRYDRSEYEAKRIYD